MSRRRQLRARRDQAEPLVNLRRLRTDGLEARIRYQLVPVPLKAARTPYIFGSLLGDFWINDLAKGQR